jgi:hypothetical protein
MSEAQLRIDDPRWDAAQTALSDHTEITHTLTPDELARAYELGRARDAKGFDGTVDLDSTDAHVIGAKGELAFGSEYGLEADTSINASGGDSGYDFELTYEGERRLVNLKVSTFNQNPWLKVRTERIEQPADTYVLAAIGADGVTIRFAGWATADEIKQTEPTMKTGSENHILDETELRPMMTPSEVTR